MNNLPLDIGIVRKNSMEEIRVYLDDHRGNKMCYLQIFKKSSRSDRIRRTHKFVLINVSRIPQLIKQLNKAYDEAIRLGFVQKPEV